MHVCDQDLNCFHPLFRNLSALYSNLAFGDVFLTHVHSSGLAGCVFFGPDVHFALGVMGEKLGRLNRVWITMSRTDNKHIHICIHFDLQK
mmetsp:Transcript_72411/g.132565  ORF Transcript_72411/g.132565 Transcript_72411/m.132565 type:complete len:90 (-) Transcript_72411:244-513(-)